MPRFESLKFFMGFLKQQKKWWLVPFIVTLLLLGVIMVFTETSALAPLIYTIF